MSCHFCGNKNTPWTYWLDDTCLHRATNLSTRNSGAGPGISAQTVEAPAARRVCLHTLAMDLIQADDRDELVELREGVLTREHCSRVTEAAEHQVDQFFDRRIGEPEYDQTLMGGAPDMPDVEDVEA